MRIKKRKSRKRKKPRKRQEEIKMPCREAGLSKSDCICLFRSKIQILIKNRTKVKKRSTSNRSKSYTKSSISYRSISIAQLNTLLCLHLRPIKLVVYERPQWISHLEVYFTLRCLQRLLHPYAATRLCPWQNNRCTGGTSYPVLSY